MPQQKRGGGARKRRTSTPGPPVAADGEGRLSVLVELRSERGGSQSMAASQAAAIDVPGFELDHEFQVVPLGENQEGLTPMGTAESFVVRGTVADEAEMDGLRSDPNVVNVWRDTPIAPFAAPATRELQTGEGMATCPIPPCDCDPATPRGTLADVATYLEVDQVWAAGFRGTGIVVAVADSGVTSLGRPVKEGETPRRIPRVVDGWPADDWGTESSRWSEHGNMCATDVLGMAPDVQLYDLRIAGSGGSPGTVSRALQAFQWAINRHRADGTPHVISNSWGIYQESWDTAYARNPSHPFIQKVAEAIDEGILVVFAAGNCGATCADSRCATDNGPGRSIWGANSHPRVMTVGAVNTHEEFIGYSSQGPGALDPNKPDFCSISHFTGYNTSDTGTSAATPILAGVVALLAQAVPGLSQDEAKAALRETAKDIGPPGWDQHSGAGIVGAKRAFDRLSAAAVPAPVPLPVPADPLRARPTVLADRLRLRAPVSFSPPGWGGPPPPPPVPPPVYAGQERGYGPPAGNGVDAEIERIAAGIEEASAYLHRLLAARDGG